MRKAIKRPKALFRIDGALPKSNRLRLYLPDFIGLSDIIGGRVNAKNLRKYFTKELSKLEAATRKERKKAKMTVVGRERILAASPFDTPNNRKFKVLPISPEGKSVRIAPRVATRNKKLRKTVLRWLKNFDSTYDAARSALNEFIKGNWVK